MKNEKDFTPFLELIEKYRSITISDIEVAAIKAKKVVDSFNGRVIANCLTGFADHRSCSLCIYFNINCLNCYGVINGCFKLNLLKSSYNMIESAESVEELYSALNERATVIETWIKKQRRFR